MEEKEKDIIWLIKKLNKACELDFNKRLEEKGLTCQQARIIFYIIKQTNKNIEVHQNDIEKEFELSKSTVSGLVSRMSNNNLIEVKKESNRSIITPTERALKIRNDITQDKSKLMQKMLNGEDEKTLDKLKINLLQLLNNMKGEEHA